MAYKNHVISTENEYLTSGFRPPDRPDHYGCDYIAANDAQITPRGVDIISIADGTVKNVYYNNLRGNVIDIEHNKNIVSRYQHLRNGAKVKIGDAIKKGQVIAVMGNTGNCSSTRKDVPLEYLGTHLHLEILENGTPVNPEPYLTGAKTIGAGTASPPAVPATPKVGDYMGDILFTNIRAYINNKQIALSTTDSKQNLSLIVVEDLAKYGFDVVYNNADRTLKVKRNKDKPIAGMYVEAMPDNVKSGDFKCVYVYTNIKTYLDGEIVSSYCIDGVTLIDFNLLARYGNVQWDGTNRELWLTLD